MNDTSSFFIEGKALFGSYPTQEIVNDFIDRGVLYFIDLTTEYEKQRLHVYNVKNSNYINFQIRDRNIPDDLHQFSKFIVKLSNIINLLREGEYLYLHCRGGHGRAGIVVSCLLCYMYNISSHESLTNTNVFHNNRVTMNEKWRKLGSPQTEKQKNFVKRLFKPIFIDNIHNKNTYYNLNNNSNDTICSNHKTYKNCNICYYSYKFPLLYNNLLRSQNYYEFKNIITNHNYTTHHTESNLKHIMINIIKYKYSTYDHIKELVKRTFIRPIIYSEDSINVGEIWCDIRHHLYLDSDLF